eukprot:COSAG02_NODE_4562_length_5215_cov_2.705043_7_plen_79_part_00
MEQQQVVDDGGTNDEERTTQEDTAELLTMEDQQMMVDAPTDVLTSNVGPGIELDFVEVARQQESRIASGYAVSLHCPS